jgi:serine phosphatase RsbU (regulator of sigma subunit)/tetratricopeptide (TPR) repeat protein
LKKHLFLFVLSFIFHESINAQIYADKNYYLVDKLNLDSLTEFDSKLLDSCLKIYHQTKNDTIKVNTLAVICERMIDNNWIQYQYFLHKLILKSLKDLNSQKGKKDTKEIKRSLKTYLSLAYNNIGYINQNQGKISLAIKYWNKSLKIQKELNDKRGMATSYNNFGFIYENQGNLPLALKNYNRSLKIKQELKDKRGMAITYSNIGNIHENQLDLKLALEYYYRCYKIYKENNDRRGMALIYNNIGNIHYKNRKIQHAKNYFYKCLKIQKEIGEKKIIASCFNNLGLISKYEANILNDDKYKKDSLLNLALEYFHKSLKIHIELEDKVGMSFLYANIGESYFEKNEYVIAQKMGKNGLKFAKEIGFLESIRINASLLAKIYLKKKGYKLAFEMRNLEIQMRDSMTSVENLKASLQQQAKFDFDKRQVIKDSEFKSKIKIALTEKKRQKTIIYSVLIGLLLLIIFLISLFNRFKLTQRQKNIIEKTNSKLNQVNVEILAQRNQIEFQKHLVEEKNREILDSITYAKRIQSAILPQPKLVKKFLEDSFILYKPKDIVAGDFYWLEVIGDLVLFAAADCTGHGVPGAMVSVVCNNGLNRAVREEKLISPELILNKTRELVVQEFEKSDENMMDGMDISICALNTQTNILHWAGANNPLWILRNGEIMEYKADKQPIGKHFDAKPFSLTEVQLEKNDIIYIFTDGFQDQFGGPKEKKFRAAQMKELFLSLADKSMEEQRKIIDHTFETWKGDLEQVDDVCVIGVRI